MAIGTPSGNPVVGIKYTKTVENDTDIAGLSNNTYFLDLRDNLVYLKDSSGLVHNILNDNTKQGALESGTNIKTINGESILGSGNLDLSFDREQDYVAPYLYLGWAVVGALTSANVWTITRVEIALDGTTAELMATNVAWDDRLTVIYS